MLATFPLLAGLRNAALLFDLVFFVVFASVLLQGTSVPLVAQWLRVVMPAEVVSFEQPCARKMEAAERTG